MPVYYCCNCTVLVFGNQSWPWQYLHNGVTSFNNEDSSYFVHCALSRHLSFSTTKDLMIKRILVG